MLLTAAETTPAPTSTPVTPTTAAPPPPLPITLGSRSHVRQSRDGHRDPGEVGSPPIDKEFVFRSPPETLEQLFAAVIAAADANADHTVVMLHEGTEITDCPGDELRRVIDVWIELGADVIAILHPHVLQGVEGVEPAVLPCSR